MQSRGSAVRARSAPRDPYAGGPRSLHSDPHHADMHIDERRNPYERSGGARTRGPGEEDGPVRVAARRAPGARISPDRHSPGRLPRRADRGGFSSNSAGRSLVGSGFCAVIGSAPAWLAWAIGLRAFIAGV